MCNCVSSSSGSVQDATPGKEYSPAQVAEADQSSNFEYMTPEEQERTKLHQPPGVCPAGCL